jgi:Flp pilus assembly protein TadG
MRNARSLRDLRRCKRGNAMIVIAATAPLLIGASAIGLDTIQVTLAKRQLQRSADSAAMAGAYALMQKQTTASAVAAVDRDLTHNNNMTLATPRVIQNAPQTGPYAGDTRAVRVVLKTTRSVPFMSFFTGSSMDIEVEATAAAVPNGNYCVVSLENTAATGVTFSGNALVNLGCGIATNSTGTSAIAFNGGPSVTASPVAARGGVPAASNFLGNTTVIPNAPAQADPFAHLPNPDISTKTCTNANTNGPTLGPGCYNGLDFKDTITLLPGTYYVNGGELSFGSKADVTAPGVTFVLTSKNAVSNPSSIASLKMNGGANVKLTAPITGEYAGLIIYQDRRAPDDSPHINGGSDAVFDGAIYLPSQDVTFNGNSGLDVVCLRLVTLRVKFSGTTDLVNNCPSNHPTRGFSGLVVRLVS